MSMTARELVVITTGIDIMMTLRSSARCCSRSLSLSLMSRESDIVSYRGIRRPRSPLRARLAVRPCRSDDPSWRFTVDRLETHPLTEKDRPGVSLACQCTANPFGNRPRHWGRGWRVRDRIGVGHFSEHRAQARWHAGAGGPQAGACGSDSAYPSRRKCHGPRCRSVSPGSIIPAWMRAKGVRS